VIALAYLCGCLAAVANAATNVMQRSANRDVGDRLQFSFALVKSLLRRPLWLASIVTMLFSFVMQAAGLGLGTLAGIEPLLVLELPLTLIGARFFLGGRLGRREWSAMVVMTAGTSGLIGFLGPSGDQASGIGWLVWLVATAATAVPVGTAYWLGRRARSPGRRAGVLGVGAGISFGLAAALTKGMTQQYASGGLGGVLAAWQLYAAAAVGLLAFWMDQNAVNAGRLATAQPGITLGDPVVSIAWGVTVFQETTRGGGWLIAAVACGAAMSVAAIVLARSPATTGEAAREEAPGESSGSKGGVRARS
jgi:drug/metabolite transporter (DMT)-like permease